MTRLTAARKIEVMQSVTFEEGEATLTVNHGETITLRITQPDPRRDERAQLRTDIAALANEDSDPITLGLVNEILAGLDKRDEKSLTWDKKPRPQEISFYLTREQAELLRAVLAGEETRHEIENIVHTQLVGDTW